MHKETKMVRIEDVAKEAGVSPTTVSYVINNRGHVSARTRERVQKVIEQLQYQPSAMGRGLASKKSEVIGILVPRMDSVSDPFFAMLSSGFVFGAQQHDYRVVLLPPETPIDNIIQSVQFKRIDGVVLSEVEQDDERVKQLYQARIPLLLFGQSALPVAWLDVDNFHGGMMATRHLLELGHRSIVHISAPLNYLYARLRCQGYEETMRQYDSSLTPVVREGDLSMDAGYRLARELLVKNPRPTAIFAGSDLMAIGVVRAATEIGLQVPRDLSVVGFDNSRLAREFLPALTTIAQQPFDLGKMLAERLIELLKGEEARSTLFKPELIVRQSSTVNQPGPLYQRSAEKITLKTGPSFSLWSNDGFIERRSGNQGVYGADTHWLSYYMVYINGIAPAPVTTDVQSGKFEMDYVVALKNGSLAIHRTLRFFAESLIDTWTWTRWGRLDDGWTFELEHAVDFRDVFEMRGFPVESHGTIHSELVGKSAERHRYHGRDDRIRTFSLSIDPEPVTSEVGSKGWLIDSQKVEGAFEIRMQWELPPTLILSVDPAFASWPEVDVENPQWQRVLKKAQDDVDMLQTDFGQGSVLVAGLPWYGALFGRDAILSAYQLLAFRPDLAESTLATMAHFQGHVMDPERSEMPGKMVHEVRYGELANLGVVPFGRYYGSVDVTPLFILLVYETWKRTGKRRVIERYLPVARDAMQWLKEAMDHDTNGLLMFHSSGRSGLMVQSWKDSQDSMVYRDGTVAKAPLAVAEVQGYVFQALRAMAVLEEEAGSAQKAQQYRDLAHDIQDKFHRHFWLDDLQYYAMAIDRHGQALDVISSDPGQCLWTGIVPDPYQGAVVSRLMESDMFSGWGIRTLSAIEKGYDPYSYHRGSVWPHDTGIVVAGMSRFGFLHEAADVATAVAEAVDRFPNQRVPELFSGIERDGAQAIPMPYPLACAPQAWSAGAVWLMLQSLLRLDIDASQRTVTVGKSPRQLGRVRIRGLSVGKEKLDFDVDTDHVRVLACPQTWTVKPDA